MSYKEDKITLLNYNPFIVTVPTETHTYVLDPCYDYSIPTLINVSFADVEYINSHSGAFRTGLLRFKSDVEAELYKELSIFNWQNIITNQEIQDILLHPTIDGLHKLLDVQDKSTFDRMYCILVSLKNSDVDLSNRVIKVINARQKEFKRGIRKTNIVLRKCVVEPTQSYETVLKKQNQQLTKQLADMQAKLDTLSKDKSTTTKNTRRISKIKTVSK